ncbi:guanylate kinase [Lachnobacterium bovis]|uniref:Guanylate kinase n=1 Tax=Lachnobacterium bovis TaxID=140626 RepID=A0A1H9U0D7_9FIRM|nr:guanylate kinase [Lachnobacterium bovis]SES02661.1 Guanylate kinase [Lachnobacterium bovis]
MNKIFCIMGKSSTGKDTIYQTLLNRKDFNIKKIIPYTTRPIRVGEENGREYFFCDEERVTQLNKENKIIEIREYNTVHGIWKYFTADDGQIDLDKNSYLLIGTLETFISLRRYYGTSKVIPIYIEVEDGERLTRALGREKKQRTPHYEEMCRRFLADQKDFSKENLKNAKVDKVFTNKNLKNTVEEIISYINNNK